MRENSALWIALVVAGGLLLAALAGLVLLGFVGTDGAAVLKQRNEEKRRLAEAERARAEAEAKLAELQKKEKEKGTDPSPQPDPPASLTAVERWQQADLREYATRIYQDYQGNAVAADNKYAGRSVAVVGEVVKVDSMLGREVIFLKAADLGFPELSELSPSLMCFCEKGERDRLATLAAGHWVAVVGQCKGKGRLGMIELEGCVLVHAARSDAELRQAFEPGR
jgi:hypothetical protein